MSVMCGVEACGAWVREPQMLLLWMLLTNLPNWIVVVVVAVLLVEIIAPSK